VPTATGETQLRLPKGSARLPSGVERLASENSSSLLLLGSDSECLAKTSLLLRTVKAVTTGAKELKRFTASCTDMANRYGQLPKS
jgi:hypothetical protein